MPDQPLAYLNALRAFEAAARHLSYAPAAAELGVTPAAVGQQVRALEAWLGVSLFRRSPGPPVRLALTEEAQAALPDLREGFDRLAQGLRRLREAKAGGIVTVTSSPAFAAKWLLARIDRFRAAHPQLDVRLDATDRLVDFAMSDADVGIRYGGGSWPGVEATLLMREEVFPVCSPRLLAGPHPLERPGDLRHHTLVHDAAIRFDADFPTWQSWLAAVGVQGVDAGRGITINSSIAVVQAVLEGQGVALARSVVVADDLRAGRLVRLFPDVSTPLRWGYHLVHRPGAATPGKVAAFKGWIIAEAKGEG
ncbi:transcriptional regulator GcvA [Aerophototrophica crusticola]|uniref:Transcriptional regulator GcvA n=1 Tax=Aerophototrophica crusticola TaxID=1709002 RepID=A0A858R6L2_9PROT|nr:transcriptional regulator GcvA [Rhodospirillaceae bacterium B3]